MIRGVILATLVLTGCETPIITSEPFDPWAYNPTTYEEFNELPISEQDKWTWLLYRREDIGVCFEDEFLNENGQCEVEE